MTLDGLTKRQVSIVERLWACNTLDEVERMKSKATISELYEINTLMLMMMQQALEERVQSMETYPDAEYMLEKLKRDYL